MVKEISVRGGFMVLVDDEDYDEIMSVRWCLSYNRENGQPYAHTSDFKGQKNVKMHRIISGAKKGQIVDHINGNTLDNRTCNLRIVSARENSLNRHHPKISRFPGVTRYKGRSRWIARISSDGKNIYLGTFETESDARDAYQWAFDTIRKGEPIQPWEREKSSKYVGVCWKKDKQKWQAYTTINKKTKHIGYFDSEEAAYEAHFQFKNSEAKI